MSAARQMGHPKKSKPRTWGYPPPRESKAKAWACRLVQKSPGYVKWDTRMLSAGSWTPST